MSDHWIPLTDLGPNQWAVVCALTGGRGFVARLASLGFTAGAAVRVLQNFGHGPLLVLLRDTRVALGRGEAAKIWVNQKGDSYG